MYKRQFKRPKNSFFFLLGLHNTDKSTPLRRAEGFSVIPVMEFLARLHRGEIY